MSLFLVVRNGPSGLFLASRLLRVFLLVFHLSSGDVKPVAAHCPVINLSRREIACDQATTMRACVLMLFLFLDCSIPDAKPVAAHCPVINLSRHDIAGDQAPTMRACVLMLSLFFDSSITDVKPVAAHCPVINLSRQDIAGDQALTMRACVLMLLLFFDSSITDVKPVAAHCPVINLSRRDIACDQATTMRACVLMLFLCLDFTVQLLVAGRRLRLAFLLCPFCCFSLSRRNLGPCLRHQPPATLELGPAGRSIGGERRQSIVDTVLCGAGAEARESMIGAAGIATGHLQSFATVTNLPAILPRSSFGQPRAKLGGFFTYVTSVALPPTALLACTCATNSSVHMARFPGCRAKGSFRLPHAAVGAFFAHLVCQAHAIIRTQWSMVLLREICLCAPDFTIITLPWGARRGFVLDAFSTDTFVIVAFPLASGI